MGNLSKNASLVYGLLVSGGASTAASLSKRAGLSQPSISRALAEIGDSAGLLMVRDGRSIAYAIERAIKDLPVSIPISRIDRDGRAHQSMELVAISGGGYLLRASNGSRLVDGLPWFLQDLRPQGYLGRAFCHAKNRELGLSDRLLDWSDDDALYAMAKYGSDLPGDLVVGNSLPGAGVNGSAPDLDALADESILGVAPGSSAGGEHPKFVVGGKIVKFSPPFGSDVSERWRDILIAEHIAAEVMRNAGIDAPTTRIVETERRCYLESDRFDRTAHGRIGLVSLMAIDNEFVGRQRSWVDSAEILCAKGMLEAGGLELIRDIHAFGRLIGNTDMHFGNLSFYYDRIDATPNLQVAPIYDMLPMMYAPDKSEIVKREFSVSDVMLTSSMRAIDLAKTYFDTLAGSSVSASFKEIASRHLMTLLESFPADALPMAPH